MKIIECPRDAMQGIGTFIPTDKKIEYIDCLLKVGFDTIDAGSFVSAKAIPQLRDSAEVFERIDWQSSSSSLLAIVANVRGAEEAVKHKAITYLGFPLSLSETFQQRNTNKSISEALNTVNDLQEICQQRNKVLVVYLSMGFGNPYGDPYDTSLAGNFVDILQTLGVTIVSLADTIGVSTPTQITQLYKALTTGFPKLEIGLHLHSHPATAGEKIKAAFEAGCLRLDGALNGLGGCPMAEDDLVGNLATEKIIDLLDHQHASPKLDREALNQALMLAGSVFPS